MEYPPGALPVFVAPTVGEPGSYTRKSKLLQLLLGATCVGLIVLATATVARRPRDLYVAALLFAVTPVLLGRITFARYDFWPAVLTLAAVVLALRGRDRLGSATLAVATAAKVYPVVLLADLPPSGGSLRRSSGCARVVRRLHSGAGCDLSSPWPPSAPEASGSRSRPSSGGRHRSRASAAPSCSRSANSVSTSRRLSSSHGSHNLAGPGAAALAAVISLVAL